jgi:hypothetical protein
MSLIKVYNFSKGIKKLINLKYVSSINLIDNKIKLNIQGEIKPIFGNFLILGGAGIEEEIISFESEKEAEEEFNSIHKSLNDYYLKKN